MKKVYLILLTVIVLSNFALAQEKSKKEFNFCHKTENQIFLDSLSKCSEFYAIEKGVIITSFMLSYQLPNQKEPKTYTVLGNSLNKAIKDALYEFRTQINDIKIYNVVGEKEGKPIKLAPAMFMFIF